MAVDFTSALYLGFRHPHRTLRPWEQLTTGRPAATEPAPEARYVAQDLARLMRSERAVLTRSTLHLYFDLFDILASDPVAIYADAGSYPIARWGIERVAAKGVRAVTFPAHDAVALKRLLHRDYRRGRRPIVVTDGICVRTGCPAPLPEYQRVVRQWDGYLVIDDTQGLGVLGEGPGRDCPYGWGGAGTPAWCGVGDTGLIIGSSLAKGFGAPLAVIASDASLIAKFEERSATLLHCSPPSLAAIGAARRALVLNETGGELARLRLLSSVRYFRHKARQIGLSALGGLFPVQTMRIAPDVDPREIHGRLLDQGIKALLRSAKQAPGAALSFLITASHTRSDIDRCMETLQRACTLLRHQHRNDFATDGQASEVFA